jgi:hypothetical protein
MRDYVTAAELSGNAVWRAGHNVFAEVRYRTKAVSRQHSTSSASAASSPDFNTASNGRKSSPTRIG